MIDYRPRPGSAAEAGLEYIRTHGGSARSSEIAAAIGVEAKQISGGLASLVEHGPLVACDVTDAGGRQQKEYRISGGGTPMPWRAPKPAAAHPSPRNARGEKVAKPVAATKATKAPRKAAFVAAVNAASPPAPQSGAGFRCGVFSDGTLVLRLQDGSLAELSPDDTRALLDYLGRAPGRAAA